MRLRIASWNIRKGGAGRRTAISAVLRALDPDIAILQEATNPAVVAWVARECEARQVVCAPGRSVALVTRRPLRSVRWHRLPTGRSALEAEVPEACLRLFGVHLSAGLSRRGERRRAREVGALLSVMGTGSERDRMVIAGDLNAIGPSDAPAIASLPRWIRLLLRVDGGIGTAVIQRLLDEGLVDAFRRLHPDEPGLTLPTARPTVRLDYFLVGPSVASEVVACTPVALEPGLLTAASDHLPLVLELDLPSA